MSERIAVFGAATDNYVPYLVTTLRSFMANNPAVDAYVLGARLSARSRGLMNAVAVNHLEIDLSRHFPRSASRQYPSECFWIFKGPELFHERGYRYSLSVDGDILCNRPLDLDWLESISHIAGIDRGASVGEFLSRIGQMSDLARIFGLTSEAMARRATNSGVLFYRNDATANADLYGRMVNVFQRSEAAGVRRGGDDSTLALALAAHPELEFKPIDEMWNAYRGLNRWISRSDQRYASHLSHWQQDAWIVHLLSIKPWQRVLRYPNRTARLFTGAWQRLHYRTVYRRPPRENRNTAVADDQRFNVCCYWYRGSKPNFGDELAPYLVRRIAGLSSDKPFPQPPRHPREVPGLVLLSMGSVLRLAHRNTVCWGPGIRNIDQPVARAHKICAVRGPLTRQRLLDLGHRCPPVYGDPALLLPRFLPASAQKHFRLGVIAHLHDAERLKALYDGIDGVVVIDMATADISGVVQTITACEHTVSSALHGIVVSVAYGIPTRWIEYSDQIMGDGTKFHDFFASLDPQVVRFLDCRRVELRPGVDAIEPYRPVRITKRISPATLCGLTNSLPLGVDLDRLMAACPFTAAGWKPDIVMGRG